MPASAASWLFLAGQKKTRCSLSLSLSPSLQIKRQCLYRSLPATILEQKVQRQGNFDRDYYCRSGAPPSQEKQENAFGELMSVEEIIPVDQLFDYSDKTGIDAVITPTYSSTSAAAVSGTTNYYGGDSGLQFIGDDLIRGIVTDAGLSYCPCTQQIDLWTSNFFMDDKYSSEQLIPVIETPSSQYTFQDNYLSPAKAASTDEPPSFTPEAPVSGRVLGKRSNPDPFICSSYFQIPSSTTESSSSNRSNAAVIQPRPAKKLKKELVVDGRTCQHCHTDRTPQWRSGPCGPKTLCNACGVRFKSGRLVPEYRPAASPTFVASEHSNSHRNVLQIRRRKNIQDPVLLPVVGRGLSSEAAAASAADAALAAEQLQIPLHWLNPDFWAGL